MKKTITKQDGSVEVVEGTAEEIAEYERKIKSDPQNESPVKKGPGRLDEDVLKRLQEAMDKFARENPHNGGGYIPSRPPGRFFGSHSEFCEITVAQRGWLCINPPRCSCGAESFQFIDPNLIWDTYITSSGDPSKIAVTGYVNVGAMTGTQAETFIKDLEESWTATCEGRPLC